jgi:hypothetical protein
MGYGPIKHFTDKGAFLFPNSSFLISLFYPFLNLTAPKAGRSPKLGIQVIS